MPTVRATSVLGRDGLVADVKIRHEGGLITAITPGAAPALPARRLIIPALVNAHDHARSSLSSFGASGMPLETWIARAAFGTPSDPYLAAAVALARSARSGCGAMMVHYTRPSGTMPMLDEAVAIARAAGDVGIRLAFALAVRDRNPLVYGDGAAVLDALAPEDRRAVEDQLVRPTPTPSEYIDLVEDIHAAVAGPMVDVQFGPAGVQWCSTELLEAVAERSALTGRRVHMHLLETVYQRAWADQAFPGGVVRHLRDIGLLSDRLALAHCTHAQPDELDMIAEAGAVIVTNPGSNLHLRSGLAPIAEAHCRGCAVAVGVDGAALDDALRELRLAAMLHGGVGFEPTWGRAKFLALAVRNGRRATGAPGSGALAPGEPADFAVLDLDALDRDGIMPVNPIDLLFARGTLGAMLDVVVAGRTIVRDGQPTGIDLALMEAEQRRLQRTDLPRYRAFERAWTPFERAVTGWFRTQGCC